MLERDTPKIATSGQLIIGVNIVPPMPPRLEMVKQPPCISSILSLRSRALVESSIKSRAISNTSLLCTSFTTGTTSPSGVSQAKPML